MPEKKPSAPSAMTNYQKAELILDQLEVNIRAESLKLGVSPENRMPALFKVLLVQVLEEHLEAGHPVPLGYLSQAADKVGFEDEAKWPWRAENPGLVLVDVAGEIYDANK